MWFNMMWLASDGTLSYNPRQMTLKTLMALKGKKYILIKNEPYSKGDGNEY